jgi:hypothetical protein
MQNDHQAEADSQQEQETVEDPLDTSNDLDQEAAELNKYTDFIDALDQEEQDYSASTDVSEESESEQELSGEEESTEQDPEEESEEGAEAEARDGSEDEEEDDGATIKSDRFRIRAKDEVEIEALSLRKRHPDWSLEECLTKAKSILGINDQAQNEQWQDGNTAQQRGVADIDAEIASLRQQHREATVSLEFEQAADLFDRLEQLRDERSNMQVIEMQRETAREQQLQESFERQFQDNEAKAVRFYPDAAKAESPMTKRIIELNEQMRQLDDPLYYSPEKPFILAKQAARDLGIPMRNPSAEPARNKSVQSKGRLIQPASGNARTTPNSSTTTKLEDTLGRIDSLEAYEDLAASL